MRTPFVLLPILVTSLLGAEGPIVHQPGEASASVSPELALARLQEGNAAFLAGHLDISHMTAARRVEVATGQHPFAAILSCADSRVPPEFLFDQGLGDLFPVRVAGAVAEPGAMGSLEYAVGHLGVRLVVVMGHTSCGAVKAAMDTPRPAKLTPTQANLESLLSLIRPALPNAALGGDPWTEAVRASVEQTRIDLSHHSPVLEELARSGKIWIVGAVYNLASGKVTFGSTPVLAWVPEPIVPRAKPKAAPVVHAKVETSAAKPKPHHTEE